MTAVRSIVPAIVLALLVVVAALPVGLPPEQRFFLPLLPVVAITVFGGSDGQRAIPDWLVFACGLVLDVLSNGPLGYWALMYLVAQVLARMSVVPIDAAWSQRFSRIAISLISVAALAWLVASLYFFAWAEPMPYIFGAALALAAAVLITPLLATVDRSGRDARLTSGFSRHTYSSSSRPKGPGS
jgi:rod shape-determining protein MreD